MECPCASGQTYDECCGEQHVAGAAGLGTTAEQLMRARYSAYVRHDAEFLLASWHPATRPQAITFDDDLVWLGLAIVDTDAGGSFDNEGSVEFQARFSRGGELLQLDERSRFVRVDGNWLYVDGT